jgi:2'-5' RNA ligase
MSPDNRPGPSHRGYQPPVADPPGTSRLFMAVPVADQVREAIAGLMEKVAGGPVDRRMPGQPRWVRVEGLHLTLRFLGPTPDVRLQELATAIATTAAEAVPFPIELSGGGAFPNQYRPRVLWIGMGQGTSELRALAARLDVELERLGWSPEDRPLTPHLTLARTDGVPGSDEKARVLIEAARDLSLGWQADRLVLYKSNLGHGPTHYEALAAAPLAGRPQG